MSISADGWLSWAEKLEPPFKKVNPGINSVKGIFMHSAEGYATVLLDINSPYGYNGNHSWHLSNLMDGRVFQHYPFTARCWHATAGNQEYIGVENEGYAPREKSLNPAQIANARMFIAEISHWKGWTPRRPVSATDITHTLWEHNEVTRLGGSGSACPSGRIPWGEILRADQEDDMANLNPAGTQRIVAEGNFIVIYNNDIPVIRYGSTDGQFPGRISKNFGGNWLWLRGLDESGNLMPLHFSEKEGD